MGLVVAHDNDNVVLSMRYEPSYDKLEDGIKLFCWLIIYSCVPYLGAAPAVVWVMCSLYVVILKVYFDLLLEFLANTKHLIRFGFFCSLFFINPNQTV